MSLIGGAQLRARLLAIQRLPKQVDEKWANATVPIAQRYIPVRTGRTRASVRRGVTSGMRATVTGNAPINFIDAGVRAHDIEAKQGTLKFTAGGGTLFRKRVHKPQQRGRPFKARAAEEGLRKVEMANELIRLWNGAA